MAIADACEQTLHRCQGPMCHRPEAKGQVRSALTAEAKRKSVLVRCNKAVKSDSLRQLCHHTRVLSAAGPDGSVAKPSSAFLELSRHSYSYCSTRGISTASASVGESVSMAVKCHGLLTQSPAAAGVFATLLVLQIATCNGEFD